ncbi:MAG: type II toxin-antitoxin system PrlF family antitoxin [Methanobrevibacter sp.]|nr:type II toxin-antitoxin system PrlF family antitoxin [Methanobrevibacter sp.]
MASITKIYDRFQTVIPSEIRKKLNLNKNDIIQWKINENGKVELEFFKSLSLDEMIGRYSAFEPINSVQLKHEFKN